MRYFLKRCTHQELGSIKDGRPQRGRYLLISMNTLDFFPPLSANQLNDSVLLPIIPLYSGKKVYCSFVYHNDKFHDSTALHGRNEHRIYLNRELENNCLLFETGDIVIIRSEEVKEGEEAQTVYLLDLVQDKNSALYRKLDDIINYSPIHGGYGIIEDDAIPEFEEKFNILCGKKETPVVIDKSVTKMIEDTDSDRIESLFNSVSFRDFVMAGYKSMCAVTGMVIRYESYINLEAAHIMPKSHGGPYMPNNGIALCRDIHWAFDKGFFTLTDDYKVKVHQKTTSDWLRSFDGKKIYLPEEIFFQPAAKNIKYHNEKIFGLFLAGRFKDETPGN